VDGLKTRITRSLGIALGRQVEVSSVSLRFLPQPGFDLENFVVHDDAELSAEPMLRSTEVVAALRIRSLLRGRLEIARLSFTDPSLNLVRSSQGRWNLEQLFRRAAQSNVAPTSQAKSGAHPAFPYIESSGGRINFKLGNEKTAYVLTDADFSLWQESENEWGLRLRAVPFRTDYNLSDTGVLKLDGTWGRSSELRQTPIRVQFQWIQAQLGQLSKFAYGEDQGWRGTVSLTGSVTGRPADLKIVASTSVDDFRRYDVQGGRAIQIRSDCTAGYSPEQRLFSDLACSFPLTSGQLTLKGTITNSPGSPSYDLSLLAEDVALQSALTLARHMKAGIPEQLESDGTLRANLRWQSSPSASDERWQGSAETLGFHLRSQAANSDLNLGRVVFRVESSPAPGPARVKHSSGIPATSRLVISQFPLQLGKNSPVLIQGSAGPNGYDIDLKGEAPVQRLTQAANLVGLRVPDFAASGEAKVDLQLAGGWSSAPAQINGKMQMGAVRTEIRDWAQPLEISNASIVLTPEAANVQQLEATVAGTSWRGSVTVPRHCAEKRCSAHIDLHADELDTERLARLLNGRAQTWYQFLSGPRSQPPSAMSANLTGQIAIDRFVIRGLTATQVHATIDFQDGKLKAEELRGQVLGGKHSGQWTADFEKSPPAYSGRGAVKGISLDQLAGLAHDKWVSGTADATYQVSFTGSNAEELMASAEGTAQVDARDGSFPSIFANGSQEALQLNHLTGHIILHNRQLSWSDANLNTGDNTYQLTGTASLAQNLKLRLTPPDGQSLFITGSLSQPHVVTVSAGPSQARLKAQ
jgi:AsmA protein